MVREWLISIFAVFGALLVGTVAGSLPLELSGYWHQPGMGFGAAFMVVAVAYLSAPKYKITYTSIMLALGAWIAWYFLEPSYYPESYQEVAYQQTHLPIIATYSGAFVAYIGCLVLDKIHK